MPQFKIVTVSELKKLRPDQAESLAGLGDSEEVAIAIEEQQKPERENVKPQDDVAGQ